MKINFKKVLLVAGPLVVLAGLIAWSNKSAAAGGGSTGSPGSPGGGGGGGGSKSGGGSTAPVFPLQLGSNNATVKVLQGYLGVTQDGVFGPATQASLYSNYCMTSVPDQATFNRIASFQGVPDNCAYPGGAPVNQPADPFLPPTVDSSTGLTTF